jgi:tRNA-binding protein
MLTISYEDFAKVDMRSGTIVRVEEFTKTRKPAYKIWADFGPELGTLQTSSQVTDHYSPEALVGKQILGCVNLGDKNIAGFKSQFLLLGFPDHEDKICLVFSSPTAPNGQRLY